MKVLTSIISEEVTLNNARAQVLGGMAKFVPPDQLVSLGLTDYLDEIPPAVRRNYDDLRSGKIKALTEPYMGNWNAMDNALSRDVFSLLMAHDGENFDYTAALRRVEDAANGGQMFAMNEAALAPYRPVARTVFAILLIALVIILWLLVRSYLEQGKNAPSGRIHRQWAPWLLLGPALVLIAMWGYFPLLQGMVMAFQDYKIVGESSYVGLDNFISLFLDPTWWVSLWHTLYFVILNMGLAFVAPILLALMLTEIPQGKVFFRPSFSCLRSQRTGHRAALAANVRPDAERTFQPGHPVYQPLPRNAHPHPGVAAGFPLGHDLLRAAHGVGGHGSFQSHLYCGAQGSARRDL